MRHECNLIRDLLPLYYDEVCSKESRNAVEEHLGECEDCRQYYKYMKSAEVVENVVYDDEKERKKAEFLKSVKKKVVIAIAAISIIIAVIIAVPIIIGAVYLIANTVSTKIEVDTNIENYSRYFGQSAEENYSYKHGMDDSIFPEKITNSVEIRDFKMVYYEPWEAEYLSYLVAQYDSDAYVKEIERLRNYSLSDYNQPIPYQDSAEYVGIYGAQGFDEKYDLLAMNAEDGGFVYALTDGNSEIIYVETIFSSWHYHMDYWEYIDSEYLPIGFDATEGNAYEMKMREEKLTGIKYTF